MEEWNGQSPPPFKHQKGKPLELVDKQLPAFGPFKKKREQLVADLKSKSDLLSDYLKPLKERPINKPKKIEKINVSKVFFKIHFYFSNFIGF